jgi:hypothetical protein
MNAQGWTISARGKYEWAKFDEHDPYIIPLGLYDRLQELERFVNMVAGGPPLGDGQSIASDVEWLAFANACVKIGRRLDRTQSEQESPCSNPRS